MTYQVEYLDRALNDLERLQKSEPKAYKKALKLITELYEHPTTGTGHPEKLRGDLAGKWSRQITRKHRMVYEVHDNEVLVIVITAYGPYDDK